MAHLFAPVLEQEAEEEHENMPATDLDEVTITVPSDEDRQPPSPSADSVDGVVQPPSPPAGVTTITIGKPIPQPRNLGVSGDSLSKATGAQVHPANDQRAVQQGASQRTEPPSMQPVGPKTTLAPAQTNPNSRSASQASQPKPPQPVHPAASNDRRMSGSTLSDLKKQRSNSRENLLDLAVQDMFLDSVQGGRQQQNSVPPGDKAKNGHNNNNNNAMQFSATDGQLRRFVAPSHSPVVGGDDDEKQNCCVIL